MPPLSWVGWGAHHAKQPHEQCCFSQFGFFFWFFLLLFFFNVKPVIPLAPLTWLHLVSAQLLPLPHQPSPLSSGCFTKQHAFHRTAIVEKANGARSRPDSILLSWAPAAGWEGFQLLTLFAADGRP